MHTDIEVIDMRQLETVSLRGMRIILGAMLTLGVASAQVAPQNGQAQGSPEPWSEQAPMPQGPSDQQGPPDVAGPGVSRISFTTAEVSVRRGDSAEPVAAAVNAPLLAGDIVATGAGAARAEVQFDFANRLRLGHNTEARIAEMESGHFHIEMARGTGTFSVLRDSQSQVEISTPNISVQPLQRGLYRVLVQDDGQTVVTVRQGEADIYTERGTQRVSAGQTIYVRGTAQEPEFQVTAAIQFDEWDQWNQQRRPDLGSRQQLPVCEPRCLWCGRSGQLWSMAVRPRLRECLGSTSRPRLEPLSGWTLGLGKLLRLDLDQCRPVGMGSVPLWELVSRGQRLVLVPGCNLPPVFLAPGSGGIFRLWRPRRHWVWVRKYRLGSAGAL